MTAIVVPCFNEGETVVSFLRLLEESLDTLDDRFTVIVVDDGSTDDTPDRLKEFRFSSDHIEVDPISLKLNLGHQGAIYQGLLYAVELAPERIVVMDGDGEDDPRVIPRLLELSEVDIVHVSRGRRREGLVFKVFYWLYRALFRVVTGKTMKFGNYTLLSRRAAQAVVERNFVHFAASLLRLRMPRAFVVAARGKRIGGRSKMRFSGLVLHAMRSLIECADDLVTFFLKLFMASAILFVGFICFVLYERLFTSRAVVGWASTVILSSLNAALVSLGFFVVGILLLNLASRYEIRKSKALYRRIK